MSTVLSTPTRPMPLYLSLWAGQSSVPQGPGPIGDSAKAAVMVEDVARTVHFALQLGQPDEIAPEDVEQLHYRYKNMWRGSRLINNL